MYILKFGGLKYQKGLSHISVCDIERKKKALLTFCQWLVHSDIAFESMNELRTISF